MSNEFFQESVSAWLDGELRPDELKTISRRLSESDELRIVRDNLRLASNVVRRLPADQVPPDFYDSVMEAIARVEAGQPSDPVSAAAASLDVAAGEPGPQLQPAPVSEHHERTPDAAPVVETASISQEDIDQLARSATTDPVGPRRRRWLIPTALLATSAACLFFVLQPRLGMDGNPANEMALADAPDAAGVFDDFLDPVEEPSGIDVARLDSAPDLKSVQTRGLMPEPIGSTRSIPGGISDESTPTPDPPVPALDAAPPSDVPSVPALTESTIPDRPSTSPLPPDVPAAEPLVSPLDVAGLEASVSDSPNTAGQDDQASDSPSAAATAVPEESDVSVARSRIETNSESTGDGSATPAAATTPGEGGSNVVQNDAQQQPGSQNPGGAPAPTSNSPQTPQDNLVIPDLAKVEVGDIVNAFDPKRVNVVRLVVVDRREGLANIEVLLSKNGVKQDDADSDELFGDDLSVFVETTPKRIAECLAAIEREESVQEIQLAAKDDIEIPGGRVRRFDAIFDPPSVQRRIPTPPSVREAVRNRAQVPLNQPKRKADDDAAVRVLFVLEENTGEERKSENGAMLVPIRRSVQIALR